jgi:hypothetical protein
MCWVSPRLWGRGASVIVGERGGSPLENRGQLPFAKSRRLLGTTRSSSPGARAALYTGTVIHCGYPTQNLMIPDAFHHDLGGLTPKEALDLSLPTWAPRGVHPRLHLSSQDRAKLAGAHAYSVDSRDWQTLLGVIGGRM